MSTLKLKKQCPYKTYMKFIQSFPGLNEGRLMTVGIHKELKAEYDKYKGHKFGFVKVRNWLYRRTSRDWYKELIEEKANRYDLNGNEHPFDHEHKKTLAN